MPSNIAEHGDDDDGRESCSQCHAVGGPLLAAAAEDAATPGGRRKPRYCNDCMIGKKVKVFWPVDESWYTGVVQEYDPNTGEHLLQYVDGDTEWVKIGEIQNHSPETALHPSSPDNAIYDPISPLLPAVSSHAPPLREDTAIINNPPLSVSGGASDGPPPPVAPNPPPSSALPPPYTNVYGAYPPPPYMYGPGAGGYGYPPHPYSTASAGPTGPPHWSYPTTYAAASAAASSKGATRTPYGDDPGDPTRSLGGGYHDYAHSAGDDDHPRGGRKSGPKPWTKEEDALLLHLVHTMQWPMKWTVVANSLPDRTGKQCRERYVNHLNPRLKNSDWTPVEDATIFHLYNTIGSHWAKMSKIIPGRTDNGIKNRFHNIRRQYEREDTHRLRLSTVEDYAEEIRHDRLRNFPEHWAGKSLKLWDMKCAIGVLAAQSILHGSSSCNTAATGNSGHFGNRFGPFRPVAPGAIELCVRCGFLVPSIHTGHEICSKTGWCTSCALIPPNICSNLLRETLNLRRCVEIPAGSAPHAAELRQLIQQFAEFFGPRRPEDAWPYDRKSQETSAVGAGASANASLEHEEEEDPVKENVAVEEKSGE